MMRKSSLRRPIRPNIGRVIATMKPEQKLLDFARMPGAAVLGERYDGFLW